MEHSNGHAPPDWTWLKVRLLHWRAGILVTSVIVFGLILNLAVLGTDIPAVAIAQVTPDAAPLETPAPLVEATQVAVSVDVTTPIDGSEVATTEVPLDTTPSDEVPEAQAPPQPAAASGAPVAQPVTPPAALAQDGALAGPAPTSTASPTTETPTTTPTTTAKIVATTTVPKATPSTAAPTTAAPTTAAPTTTQAPTTTETPTTTEAPTTTAAAPATEYITYTVSGGVGQVILAKTGTSITLYGFYPNSGWVSQTESNGPRTVKLQFFNTQTEQDREWKATIEGGRIQVEN